MYKCTKCQWLGKYLVYFKEQGHCPCCRQPFKGCFKYKKVPSILLSKGEVYTYIGRG